MTNAGIDMCSALQIALRWFLRFQGVVPAFRLALVFTSQNCQGKGSGLVGDLHEEGP